MPQNIRTENIKGQYQLKLGAQCQKKVRDNT